MTAVLALFALGGVALACDGECEHEHADASVVIVTDGGESRSEPYEDHDDRHRSRVEAQYSFQALPYTPAHEIQVRHLGEKDAYVGVDARWFPDQAWMGRASAGFDILGGGGLDLKLGVFLGTAGYVEPGRATVTMRPQLGTDVTLGARWNRLYGQARFLHGVGGTTDPLLTENSFTVGYRVVDDIRVFGQMVNLEPEGPDHARERGFGIGVKATF